MDDDRVAQLFEFADLVLAVGRQLRAVQERSADTCTPVESMVMRAITRHPGVSARDAARATNLPSSNFSRHLRGLEQRGLVRREVSPHDARTVQLFPTERARSDLDDLARIWAEALSSSAMDVASVEALNNALQLIDERLRSVESQ